MAATRIELPTQLEAYIQFKIDSGLYSNGVEVIRDALRHMMEREGHYFPHQKANLAFVQAYFVLKHS